MNKKNLTQLSASSMLIILMGSLGDVARGILIVDPIKRQFPQSHITWLIDIKWYEFIQLHSKIDRIIAFHRPKGLKGVRLLQKELDAHRFDITLDMQRILKSGFFSWLSKSPRRIGFHPQNAKEFNWLFNTEHIDFFDERKPKWRHYLQFLKPLQIAPPAEINFGLSEDKLDHILAALNPPAPPHPYIGIIMGSSWPSKDWPYMGYQELLERLLAKHHLNIVLLGDKSQIRKAAQLTDHCQSPQIVNSVGQTNLVEMAAIIKNAVLCVGPDSGPGHVAAALKTPHITLFGPTPVDRVVPYGCEDLAITAGLSCAPCKKRNCPLGHQQCMKMISAVTVEQRISQYLRAYRTGRLPHDETSSGQYRF